MGLDFVIFEERQVRTITLEVIACGQCPKLGRHLLEVFVNVRKWRRKPAYPTVNVNEAIM